MKTLKAGEEMDLRVARFVLHQNPEKKADGTWDVPKYSTEMGAAWLVVEELRKQGCDFDFYTAATRIQPGWADAIFLTQTDEYHERAETPALAICLAALQVGRVKTEESSCK